MLGRWLRWAREQPAFLTVLVALAACFGYLLVQPQHPVRGTVAIAVVILLAAVLRAVLPVARAGLLAVRGRCTDTVCYAVLGLLILGTDIRLKH